ncbi:leucine-rich repeat-containing protein 61 isoform X1 [Cuculus canorus]|uniref:leucine-rich repeat-containing protein 61 isoform X1 n=2 Tax=Cuculus canorus TaxID=55661 RepID=UPI0023AA4AE3|nr:leucine-rich repeat-containing protein 61 isoform X1 [Cuculus canorus]
MAARRGRSLRGRRDRDVWKPRRSVSISSPQGVEAEEIHPPGMEPHGDTAEEKEKEEDEEEEEEGVTITAELLKATTGDFTLESILLLKLRARGIVRLGSLGHCTNLEWLDLSRNSIVRLDPLATLKSLSVLNVAHNRVVNLEPLRWCPNLQSLNVAGNPLKDLQQLRCLMGLQRLENLRLRDPTAPLENPLCSASTYRSTLVEMFPNLKAIDGERISGRGEELLGLWEDLESFSGSSGGDEVERCGGVEPWVEAEFWEPRLSRRRSIVEEAYRQFGEVVEECRELSRSAEDTIARARRALSGSSEPNSYVF